MTKKLGFFLFLFFLLLALLFSLGIPRRDVHHLAQVAGVALDYENGRIKATFEFYAPSVEQPIGAQRKVLICYGETIESCVKEAEKLQGKELFMKNASVLILGDERLLEAVRRYYCKFINDRTDLPIYFTVGQAAGTVFNGEGEVVSDQLDAASRHCRLRYTVLDMLNGKKGYVYIKGEGGFELVS